MTLACAELSRVEMSLSYNATLFYSILCIFQFTHSLTHAYPRRGRTPQHSVQQQQQHQQCAAFVLPSFPSFPSLLSDPPTPLVVFLCHCTPLPITYLYSPPPDTDTDLDTDIQTTLGQYSSSSLTKK